jgi:hypothetical protein
MSSLVISGDTSGTVTLAAPAVAGTNTLTLQAATATSAVNTLATAVASTSGTSITFTGIPSWAKRISVILSGVSLSSTANLLIQIGSGSTTTTGYVTYSTSISNSGTPVVTAPTDGFRINTSNAANTVHGKLSLDLITGTTYVGSGLFGGTQGASVATFFSTSGTIALSGALDRVVITSTSTDTFDAGSINILYEG